MSALDRVTKRLRDGLQPSAYDDHMGFRFQVDEVAPGHTVFLADVDEHLHNPGATLHGGVLAGLADSAMGSAMFTILGDGETCTNVDLTARFLRPTQTGTLRAVGSIVKEGRRICVARAEITNEEGTLVATAEATFVRLEYASRAK